MQRRLPERRREPPGARPRPGGELGRRSVLALGERHATQSEERERLGLGVLGRAGGLQCHLVAPARRLDRTLPAGEQPVAVQREGPRSRRLEHARVRVQHGCEECTAARVVARQHPEPPDVGGKLGRPFTVTFADQEGGRLGERVTLRGKAHPLTIAGRHGAPRRRGERPGGIARVCEQAVCVAAVHHAGIVVSPASRDARSLGAGCARGCDPRSLRLGTARIHSVAP